MLPHYSYYTRLKCSSSIRPPQCSSHRVRAWTFATAVVVQPRSSQQRCPCPVLHILGSGFRVRSIWGYFDFVGFRVVWGLGFGAQRPVQKILGFSHMADRLRNHPYQASYLHFGQFVCVFSFVFFADMAKISICRRRARMCVAHRKKSLEVKLYLK